jgi:large subunit ribosomal protein L21
MSYAVIRRAASNTSRRRRDLVRSSPAKPAIGRKTTRAVIGGAEPKLGKGKLAGVSVEGEIVGEVKGDKLVVFKFRRRKRSRKKNGHRQLYTAVKITKVAG